MTDVSPSLVARVRDAFARGFGGEPTLLVASPGRVNLIGEHTDYNDGFVMPCAIDRHTLIAIRAREDGEARVLAADYGDAIDHFALTAPIAHNAALGWSAYIRGTVAECLARGHHSGGFDMAITGDIPQGMGLSSSASLEVGVATALSALGGWDVDPTEAALIGQAAENGFVGVSCGIMDQLAAARGRARQAVTIDCRTLECSYAPIADDLALVVIDSAVQRGLVGSAYNERRRQCEAAARHFGVAALRDLTLAELESRFDELDSTVARRVRHVVTENLRVLAMREALARQDLARVGALMRESHASMRDDFEITVPPIDRLSDIANAAIGDAGGARMTGGGFGGCVVALTTRDRIPALRDAIARDYRAPGGSRAEAFDVRATDGAGICVEFG